jgi:ATP-dependent RecD-like DNA helicase SH3 domain
MTHGFSAGVDIGFLAERDLTDQLRGMTPRGGNQGASIHVRPRCSRLTSDIKSQTAKTCASMKIRFGDNVMQIENDYDKECFNCDLGVLKSVDPDAQEVVITFAGRNVSYNFGELDDVSLAFATGVRISGRGHPDSDDALRDAAAESRLHRRHAGQEAGRSGRAAEQRWVSP